MLAPRSKRRCATDGSNERSSTSENAANNGTLLRMFELSVKATIFSSLIKAKPACAETSALAGLTFIPFP
jgi:hypothetical protein